MINIKCMHFLNIAEANKPCLGTVSLATRLWPQVQPWSWSNCKYSWERALVSVLRHLPVTF